MKTIVVYAWCFDHGTPHCFQPGAPWCTANWVHLDAYSEEAALAIIGLAEGRRTPGDEPSVQETAYNDRRWFDSEKAGEQA